MDISSVICCFQLPGEHPSSVYINVATETEIQLRLECGRYQSMSDPDHRNALVVDWETPSIHLTDQNSSAMNLTCGILPCCTMKRHICQPRNGAVRRPIECSMEERYWYCRTVLACVPPDPLSSATPWQIFGIRKHLDMRSWHDNCLVLPSATRSQVRDI